MRVDAVSLRVFTNILSSICQEMGMVLCRTAFSPNIKERRDYSCAVFTADGDMVAQASHIPVHLGSMPHSTRAVIKALKLEEGDMAMLNDPFQGGTHLPDITLVAPVYIGGEPVFYVANRAHHADVGGMSPGSMPMSTSIFQEGLIIPPVRMVKGGSLDEELLNIFLANVRTPTERRGDLEAQIAANVRGIKRIKETVERYGLEFTKSCLQEVMNYTERLTRAFIKRIPDGTYTAEDHLEFPGEKLTIKVSISVKGDEMVVDFTGSSPQSKSPLNAVKSITTSCVLYVIRCLLPEDAPTNQGLLRPVKVIAPEGTVVNASRPAPISAGNVETSQRIVDVLLEALGRALPDAIPASSQGTMNNLLIGGEDPPFVYYETIGGGMGACPRGDGESAIHSHMTNTMNTPVEALEFAYPLMVREYRVRRGSGGKGALCGGDGIVREIELLADAEVTILSQRREIPPKGARGGGPGAPGRNLVYTQSRWHRVPAIHQARLKKGDRVRIETPGGGGYGR